GVAGALYEPLIGYLTPGGFDLLLSSKFLLMTILGGRGFIPAAINGAAFVVGLDVWLSERRNWSQFVFGVIVIFLMVVEPQVLYGRWVKIRRFWKSWPL